MNTKRKKLVCIGLLTMLCLSGCTSKESSNVKELYEESMSENNIVDLSENVNVLVDAFNSRYSMNDELINIASDMFTDKDKFKSAYELWKSKLENETNIDKLYINSYIKDAEDYYNEAKEFGLKHGLLDSDGKQTNTEPVMDENIPLLDSDSNSDLDMSEINNGEENEINNLSDDVEISKEDEDAIFKEYLDELYAEEPNYVSISRDEIESDINNMTTKEELENYFVSKYKGYMLGDWGDYEPTTHERAMSGLCHIGYNDSGDGIIEESDWENLSLDEAKEHLIKVLLYDYDYVNRTLLDNYNLINTEEYKQKVIEERKHNKEKYKQLLNDYDIVDEDLKESVDETESINSETDPYTIWCKENEDIILYIKSHDFEKPEFSEVIEKDEVGYYIPWQRIYDLAQEDGKLSKNLSFVAYGETITVEMPEAPQSYYNDKTMSLIGWEVSVDTSGNKNLELKLNMPDKQNMVELSIGLTDEDKFIYNSDISTLIFN